jgi:hypothetical protein
LVELEADLAVQHHHWQRVATLAEAGYWLEVEWEVLLLLVQWFGEQYQAVDKDRLLVLE